MSDQTYKAIQNAWDKWPVIKDTVIDYGFKDWCRRVNGFEYQVSGDDVSTKILDEKKYAWFLLRWS